MIWRRFCATSSPLESSCSTSTRAHANMFGAATRPTGSRYGRRYLFLRREDWHPRGAIAAWADVAQGHFARMAQESCARGAAATMRTTCAARRVRHLHERCGRHIGMFHHYFVLEKRTVHRASMRSAQNHIPFCVCMCVFIRYIVGMSLARRSNFPPRATLLWREAVSR